jgi:hypothetical protein
VSVPGFGAEWLEGPVLAFLSPPDLSDAGTVFRVSEEPIIASTDESGFIEVAFAAVDGSPALPDLSKLELVAPGSGLVFGEFVEVPVAPQNLTALTDFIAVLGDPDPQLGNSWSTDLYIPTGVYRASFVGSMPGDWPVEVRYDGELVSVLGGANSVAHVVGGVVPPEGLELRATVTTRCIVGRPYLYVTVQNASGETVDLTLETVYGTKTWVGLVAGKSAAQTFNTRVVEYPEGFVTLRGVGVSGATGEVSFDYGGGSC